MMDRAQHAEAGGKSVPLLGPCLDWIIWGHVDCQFDCLAWWVEASLAVRTEFSLASGPGHHSQWADLPDSEVTVSHMNICYVARLLGQCERAFTSMEGVSMLGAPNADAGPGLEINPPPWGLQNSLVRSVQQVCSSSYREGNWGIEEINDLPVVMELLTVQGRI